MISGLFNTHYMSQLHELPLRDGSFDIPLVFFLETLFSGFFAQVIFFKSKVQQVFF